MSTTSSAVQFHYNLGIVCLDDPVEAEIAMNCLMSMGYHPDHVPNEQEVLDAFRLRQYALILVPEVFLDGTLDSNQVLQELIAMNSSARREQFCVLAGPSLSTGDDMQAFVLSVDLVVNSYDLPNLGEILKVALTRKQEKNELIRQAQTGIS